MTTTPLKVANIQIVAQKEYDRIVFLFYVDGKLEGINFQQGLEFNDFDFCKPNNKLFIIYLELLKSHEKTKDFFDYKFINDSIEVYMALMDYFNDNK